MKNTRLLFSWGCFQTVFRQALGHTIVSSCLIAFPQGPLIISLFVLWYAALGFPKVFTLDVLRSNSCFPPVLLLFGLSNYFPRGSLMSEPNTWLSLRFIAVWFRLLGFQSFVLGASPPFSC